jgi:hypothetical protein
LGKRRQRCPLKSQQRKLVASKEPNLREKKKKQRKQREKPHKKKEQSLKKRQEKKFSELQVTARTDHLIKKIKNIKIVQLKEQITIQQKDLQRLGQEFEKKEQNFKNQQEFFFN